MHVRFCSLYFVSLYINVHFFLSIVIYFRSFPCLSVWLLYMFTHNCNLWKFLLQMLSIFNIFSSLNSVAMRTNSPLHRLSFNLPKVNANVYFWFSFPSLSHLFSHSYLLLTLIVSTSHIFSPPRLYSYLIFILFPFASILFLFTDFVLFLSSYFPSNIITPGNLLADSACYFEHRSTVSNKQQIKFCKKLLDAFRLYLVFVAILCLWDTVTYYAYHYKYQLGFLLHAYSPAYHNDNTFVGVFLFLY